MRGMVTIGKMNRDRDTSETYAVTVDLWEQHGTARMRCMAQRETWRDELGNLRIKEHRQIWQVVPVERQGIE
ncbi:hypothetical protein SAMN05518854_11725 [Variovorax sp. YR266]|nr:hypothetical protein SAMN05518854_11725 [Variovorax sp. YR266]